MQIRCVFHNLLMVGSEYSSTVTCLGWVLVEVSYFTYFVSLQVHFFSKVILICHSNFIFARCMVSMMNAKGSMVMLMHGDIAPMFLTILHFQLL